MPSLIEKMQPWTQTSFIPTNLLRRSLSSSSASSTAPLASSQSVTSSLSASGGSIGSSSSSGGSDIVFKSNETKSKSGSSTRAGGGTGSSGSSSFFGRICSAASSSNTSKNSSSGISSSKSNGGSSNNNDDVCNGPRPKRKTPILSTCMKNWVKFDHDCQKPLHCAECEKNQERKILFNSGDRVLISTGSKGKLHHHRHSHNFIDEMKSHSHVHRHHHTLSGGVVTLSEPASPTECVVSANNSMSSGGDSHNNTFPGEVVSWENAKNKSSFKIVIDVPCLAMTMFQKDNVQVEIVCRNKAKGIKDLETVQRTQAELKCSGWYWEGIDSEASREILESTQPGAFIVRDSKDPRFLYSLSIQTERGPTSVRLPYRNGKFQLDGDDDRVPKFDSVISLIEHYVNGGTKIGRQVSVWVDHRGNMHSAVKLSKPVRKEVGSLKHLARVALNKYNLLTNNNNNSQKLCGTSALPVNGTSSSTVSGPSTSRSCSPTTSASAVTSNTYENSPLPCPLSSESVTVVADSSDVAPIDSSTGTTAPVADLSKLPPSLETYMLEYSYKL